MRTLTGIWIEWFAAGIMAVTSLFSFANGQYGVAVIAGACSGLVAGIVISKALYRQ